MAGLYSIYASLSSALSYRTEQICLIMCQFPITLLYAPKGRFYIRASMRFLDRFTYKFPFPSIRCCDLHTKNMLLNVSFYCSCAIYHKNLFGKNQKLNLSLERGQIDSLFRINYTDPWIEGDDKRTSRSIMVQVV